MHSHATTPSLEYSLKEWDNITKIALERLELIEDEEVIRMITPTPPVTRIAFLYENKKSWDKHQCSTPFIVVNRATDELKLHKPLDNYEATDTDKPLNSGWVPISEPHNLYFSK